MSCSAVTNPTPRLLPHSGNSCGESDDDEEPDIAPWLSWRCKHRWPYGKVHITTTYWFISSRGLRPRRRTLQDLMTRPSATLCRSFLRLSEGYTFSIRWNFCGSRSRLWVSRWSSLWDLMRFCEKNAKSWEFLRFYSEVAKLRNWLPGGCEVANLTTRSKSEFQPSSFNQRILTLEFLRVWLSHRVLENSWEFVHWSRS